MSQDWTAQKRFNLRSSEFVWSRSLVDVELLVNIQGRIKVSVTFSDGTLCFTPQQNYVWKALVEFWLLRNQLPVVYCDLVILLLASPRNNKVGVVGPCSLYVTFYASHDPGCSLYTIQGICFTGVPPPAIFCETFLELTNYQLREITTGQNYTKPFHFWGKNEC